MSLHAIEISLNRTIRSVELRAAERDSKMTVAASEDGRKLAVLVSAKNERQAIKKIWRRLESVLPIDTLCSLFPAKDGTYLMSIPMDQEASRHLRDRATAAGTTPESILQQAIIEALARDRSNRQAKLDSLLNSLLREFTPEEVARQAARRIRP